MANPTVGLAIITQNEEYHMPPIAQFYHAVDDIVVVDGGSADASVVWAERMGARVIRRPFKDDFSDQKNFAISQLATDWVYLHDPDERLEPTALEIIRPLCSAEGQEYLVKLGVLTNPDVPFDCFGFARKNIIDGVQNEVYPDYQYRLFANYCKFEGVVHEKITNFKNRTEIDSMNQISRFNILHYKSSSKQAAQDEMYRRIKGE